MKVSVVANGKLENKKFHKSAITNADIIIAADGGANHCAELKLTPDYIIGDLDSIKSSVLKKFRLAKTQIILDPDQNKTDLELSLEFAIRLKATEINIFGALGSRVDHSLSNLFVLTTIPNRIKVKVIDQKNEIQLISKDLIITGNKGDIVSVIPLTKVTGLCYDGLKWNLNNKTTLLGWHGISNVMTRKNAKISLKSGKIIVIKSKE